jgi:hypothetical protein
MAHEFGTRSGKHHSVNELVSRLQTAFEKVSVDVSAGRQEAEGVLRGLRQYEQMPSPPMPREQIDQLIETWTNHLSSAARIRIRDSDASEVEFLAVDNAPILVSYDSVQSQNSGERILNKCAPLLGYEIELV